MPASSLSDRQRSEMDAGAGAGPQFLESAGVTQGQLKGGRGGEKQADRGSEGPQGVGCRLVVMHRVIRVCFYSPLPA